MQIIPATVQQATPATIKVQKHNKVPRAPRISGEERSSPGNRTGTYNHENHFMISTRNFCIDYRDFTVTLTVSYCIHVFILWGGTVVYVGLALSPHSLKFWVEFLRKTIQGFLCEVSMKHVPIPGKKDSMFLK